MSIGCTQNSPFNEEYRDLNSKIDDFMKKPVQSEENRPYSLDLPIGLGKNGNVIHYDVILKPIGIEMKHVVISAMINNETRDRLNPSLGFSSTVDFKKPVDLDTVKVNEYEFGMAFGLDFTKINQRFLDHFKKILIKMTWDTIDGQKNTDYIVLEGDPSTELEALLESKKELQLEAPDTAFAFVKDTNLY